MQLKMISFSKDVEDRLLHIDRIRYTPIISGLRQKLFELTRNKERACKSTATILKAESDAIEQLVETKASARYLLNNKGAWKNYITKHYTNKSHIDPQFPQPIIIQKPENGTTALFNYVKAREEVRSKLDDKHFQLIALESVPHSYWFSSKDNKISVFETPSANGQDYILMIDLGFTGGANEEKSILLLRQNKPFGIAENPELLAAIMEIRYTTLPAYKTRQFANIKISGLPVSNNIAIGPAHLIYPHTSKDYDIDDTTEAIQLKDLDQACYDTLAIELGVSLNEKQIAEITELIKKAQATGERFSSSALTPYYGTDDIALKDLGETSFKIAALLDIMKEKTVNPEGTPGEWLHVVKKKYMDRIKPILVEVPVTNPVAVIDPFFTKNSETFAFQEKAGQVFLTYKKGILTAEAQTHFLKQNSLKPETQALLEALYNQSAQFATTDKMNNLFHNTVLFLNRITNSYDLKEYSHSGLKGKCIITSSIDPVGMNVLIKKGQAAGAVSINNKTVDHPSAMAKGRNFPFIVGVTDDIFELIDAGDMVIINGVTGELIIKPTQNQLIEANYMLKKLQEQEHRYNQLKGQDLTIAGKKLKILVNIDNSVLADTHPSTNEVGLMRTETFMDEPLDSKQWQNIFQQLFKKYAKITVRNPDWGRDKNNPYWLPDISFVNQDGRIECLHLTEYIKLQPVREAYLAMYRGLGAAIAATNKNKQDITLLFSMVDSVEQLLQYEAIVEAAGLNPKEFLIKIMEETPAALQNQEIFNHLENINFSLGANDLIDGFALEDGKALPLKGEEYHRPDVKEICAPKTIQALEKYFTSVNAAGKSVTICGEAGSDVVIVALLRSFGYFDISVGEGIKPELFCTLYDLSKKETELAEIGSTLDLLSKPDSIILQEIYTNYRHILLQEETLSKTDFIETLYSSTAAILKRYVTSTAIK